MLSQEGAKISLTDINESEGRLTADEIAVSGGDVTFQGTINDSASESSSLTINGGTAGNPGDQESFFGEVDDVLAAADFLRQRDDVDRNSIYLGGHGTGATLAMLVAASTDRFRAVFAFAPVDDPNVYGRESLTYDPSDEKERRLRAPLLYASSIRKPTFIIDGSHDHESFMNSFRSVENPKLFCYTVIGANLYSILSPSNRLIASKISSLDGSSKGGLSEDELNQAFEDGFHANRQARDLETLARLRRDLPARADSSITKSSR